MNDNPPLVYDIGMHTGKDTEFYLRKGFRVVAVEAHPELASQAKVKFASAIAEGQLVIIDKAVVDSSCQASRVTFYVNDSKSDWGTLLPDWCRSMDSNFRAIEVPAVRFDEILEQYGIPYYMKIDIEGSEAACLKSLLKFPQKPTYLSVELPTIRSAANTPIDATANLCLLYANGYRKFRVVDQSQNYRRRAPFPPLEGEFVDYVFDGETSGLFGKELSAEELTIDEVLRLYLDYFYNNKNGFFAALFCKKKPNIFHAEGWFDVHASF